MLQSSVIEISRSALLHNYHFFREHFGEELTISSVVKGNAYGHGIDQFVPLAQDAGARHFSVFSADEAQRVLAVIERPAERRARRAPPPSGVWPAVVPGANLEQRTQARRVCIMGYVDDPELEWAVANGLEVWIFEQQRLDAAIAAAQRVKRRARLHLEVETGLHRTGFDRRELATVARKVKAHREHLQILGVCTHFAGAESQANYLRIQQQIENFSASAARLWNLGVRPRTRHTACSAAALVYPRTRGDLIRLGIAQYGFWPSRETYIDFAARHDIRGTDPLHRVLTWKTRVMAIKKVKAGEFVGYGSTYLPEQKTRLAVIPVGYATGFSRNLSNRGRVLIRGRRASVAGVVNMNLALVNVTNIPGVKRGDEVVLLGSQGKLTISAGSFSDLAQMINYELLTRLPQNITRRVVD